VAVQVAQAIDKVSALNGQERDATAFSCQHSAAADDEWFKLIPPTIMSDSPRKKQRVSPRVSDATNTNPSTLYGDVRSPPTMRDYTDSLLAAKTCPDCAEAHHTVPSRCQRWSHARKQTNSNARYWEDTPRRTSYAADPLSSSGAYHTARNPSIERAHKCCEDTWSCAKAKRAGAEGDTARHITGPQQSTGARHPSSTTIAGETTKTKPTVCPRPSRCRGWP
jgi:hypothetical protein